MATVSAAPAARVALVCIVCTCLCCIVNNFALIYDDRLQVTGANQGIGLEIVRQLCRKFDGTVLLAGSHVSVIVLSMASPTSPAPSTAIGGDLKYTYFNA